MPARLAPRRASLATALAAALCALAAPAPAASLPGSATPPALDSGEAAGGPRTRRPTTLDTVEVAGEQIEGYDAERSSTATKTDTPLLDIPQSITVVTHQMIRDQAMQGMADVVRYVPGIGMAQGEGNRDTPIVRGSSSTADLFVDGIRDDVQYFRDLYNIDRVEALKGPNAMIFGRGGTGGVINRVSKQGRWDTIASSTCSSALATSPRAPATSTRPSTKAPPFASSAMFEDSDSFRDGVSARALRHQPGRRIRSGDSTIVSLGVEHFDDERTADRGIPSSHGRPVDVDRSTFFGDPERSAATVDRGCLQRDDRARLRQRPEAAQPHALRDYDKFYQNVFPGSVFADDSVAI